jgi:hypothetical protein
MNFYEFIRSVPDVMWSGLLASALTLGGVLLTNWNSTVRLRMQLSHDANIKSQERTSSLRREVYLDAAKKIPKALGAIIDSINSDESFRTSPDLSDFFSVTSQIQLVAEPWTASLVTTLVSKYNDLLMKFTFSRTMFDLAVSERNSWKEKYEISTSECGRMLLELNKLKEISPADSKMIDVVTGAYERYLAETTVVSSELQSAEVKVVIERLNLLKLFMPNVRDISNFHVVVSVAVRRDLGFSTDEELFGRQMKSQLILVENLIDYLDGVVLQHCGNKA